jgi:DNA-binding GntR family transcriptional regulator
VSSRQTPLIDQDLKLPRYMQVYTTLYQWVAQGTYPAGARLESEGRLCEMFGVSRITVRKALDMLTQEGLLASVLLSKLIWSNASGLQGRWPATAKCRNCL